MKAKTLTRLENLEKHKQPDNYKMMCDNGETFNVFDPLEYVIENGNIAPNGRRVISVVPHIGRGDAISAAFDDYVNAVLDGREILFTKSIDLLQSDWREV